MFHFRVRDGTGWDHQAKTTGVLMQSLLSSLAALGQLSRVSLAGILRWGWCPVGQIDIRAAFCVSVIDSFFKHSISVSPRVI